MRARSAARQAALQMLFAADMAQADAETVVFDYWREFPGDADDRKYADTLLRGVLADGTRIDATLRSASDNWRLERMTTVARNVLRLAAWELLEQADVPSAVILDEAVELAKRFDGPGSSAFVNGILNRIARECGRRHDLPEPRARESAPDAPKQATGSASEDDPGASENDPGDVKE